MQLQLEHKQSFFQVWSRCWHFEKDATDFTGHYTTDISWACWNQLEKYLSQQDYIQYNNAVFSVENTCQLTVMTLHLTKVSTSSSEIVNIVLPQRTASGTVELPRNASCEQCKKLISKHGNAFIEHKESIFLDILQLEPTLSSFSTRLKPQVWYYIKGTLLRTKCHPLPLLIWITWDWTQNVIPYGNVYTKQIFISILMSDCRI